MLHYYPRHVSSINMPIFRRTNCIHTASGIVVLCKRLHSTPVESGLLCSPLSTGRNNIKKVIIAWFFTILKTNYIIIIIITNF